MDSEEAKRFVLLPRRFQGKWEHDDDEDGDNSVFFWPAFPDPFVQTPLRQNTIAAYLLRSFGDAKDSPIFDTVKEDALAKAVATRDVIEREL